MNSTILPDLPPAGRRAIALLPWLVLILSLGLTCLWWHSEGNYAAQEKKAEFDFRARELETRITQRMLAYEQVLRGAQGFFAASEQVSRADFQQYVATLRLSDHYPGIQGVGYTIIVPPSQREQHEAEIRAEGFPEYNLRPPGARELYTAIIYLEPFRDRNLRAFGYDMFSEPVRRQAMERARDTGEASLSGRVTLVQETTNRIQSGFLMYLPVYRKGTATATVDQRRAHLMSWVYAPFRADDLMAHVQGERETDLNLEIYDGALISDATRMHQSAAPAGAPRFRSHAQLKINGQTWSVVISSLPGFEASAASQGKPRLIATTGVSLSCLLALTIWFLVNGRSRAYAMARTMTKELQESEARYRFLFEKSPDAYLILDAGIFTDCNAAAPALLRGQREQVIGRSPHQLAPERQPDGQLSSASIAAHSQKALSGGTARFEWLHQRFDGTEVVVDASMSLMPEAARPALLVTWRDITVRKQVEAELERRTALLSCLLDSIPDLVFFKNVEGTYLGCNPAFAQFVGHPRNHIIGRTDYQLFPESVAAAFRQQDKKVMGDSQPRHNAEWICYPDGRKLLVDTLKSPLQSAAGECVGVLGVSRDITADHEASERIRQLNERFSLAVDSAEIGVWDWDVSQNRLTWDARMHTLYGMAEGDFTQAYAAWTSCLHPEDAKRCQAEIQQALGGGAPFNTEFRIVWRTGEVRHIRAFARVERDPQGQPRRMTGINYDITERKQMEEALRSSEENFRTFFATVDDMILVGTPEGRIRYANDAVTRKLGYRAEELATMDILALHPVEKRAEASEVFRAMLRNERSNCPLPLVAKAGHLVPVETRIWFGKWDGANCLFGICKDLTAEQEAHQRFERLFRNNPSLMALSTLPERTFADVNEAFLKTLGYTKQEVLGRSSQDLNLFVHPQQQAALAEQLLLEGRVHQVELQARCKDGTILAGLFSGEVISSHGRQYFLTVMMDITPRKRAEEALREVTDRLALAVRAGRVGIWDYDVAHDRMVWDEAMLELYGLAARKFAGTYQAWLAGIHPDDRDLIAGEIDQALAGTKEFESEFRVVHPDGNVRHLGAVALVQRDAQGNALHMIGTNWDITSRKRVEAELCQQSRLQQLLMEISSTYINLPLEEVESAIQTSLGNLAQFVGADRAYIFDYDYAQQICINTHEWCAEGISAQIQELQAVPLAALTEWLATHRQGRQMYIPDVQALRPGGLRDILAPQEIKSLLTVPLMSEGEAIGFVGFDSVRHHHAYTDCEQRLLVVFSQMLVNIRRRKQADMKLRKLSQAVEFSPLMIMITDHLGRVDYANPAWERSTGYLLEEVLGHKPRALKSGIHPREFYAQMWNEITTGKIWHGEFCNRRKNGTLYWESAAIAPVRDNAGTITHFIAVKEDITAQRQAAAELREAKEAADAANRAKSAFLANMSHEIRTPMNAILGFSQLLLNDPGASALQRQHLTTITRSGEHLMQIINDILEMARIESGRITLNPAVFDLRQLLADVEQMFSARTRAKGLNFRMTAEANLPQHVCADETKLRQVLINLLGNALKFTDSGRIDLRMRCAQNEGNRVQLVAEVEDTGPGIAPEDLPRLFDPFFQTSVGKQVPGGTGLGLPISREFIRLMGGDLTVHSQVGQGTICRVEFWASEGDPQAMPAAGKARKALRLQPAHVGCSVLVVDDEPANRELVEHLLTPLGFAVSSAVNGEKAVACCATSLPRLILMDLRMPVMDGYEAMRQLRAKHENQPCIIALSASVFKEDSQKSRECGANAFLAKPIRESDLLETIRQQIGVAEPALAVPPPAPPASTHWSTAHLVPTLVEQLRQAVTRAEYDRMLELVGHVSAADAPLAQHMRQLVEQYDYTGLQRLLTKPDHQP